MQYRKFGTTGEDISLLGLGTMRFPIIDDIDSQINEKEAIKIIRAAIDGGVNYMDTAYMYHGGYSERVLGKALLDGYREKVYVADKFPVWKIREAGGIEELFSEQLKRLSIERFDFYLVHALDRKMWQKVKEKEVLPFLVKCKEDGRIGKLGFSFHDDLELFKEIVDDFPWEFCQIQLNYIDTEFQAGIEGLKYAAKKGLPVIVMEPLKGGKLTENQPESVKAILDKAETKRSPAEWAFRFIADFPEVITILSGISTMEQIQENLAIFSAEERLGLTDEEKELVQEAANEYDRLTKAGCTKCKYCLPCPQEINIPVGMDFYNEWHRYHTHRAIKRDMEMNMPKGKRASDCIDCKECEEKCPQKLPITDIMKEMAEIFKDKE